MREFFTTLLLRIKLLCVTFGWVKDVTNQSKYYTKLKEYNIRLFASRRKRKMIYVVRNNKIILKSYKPLKSCCYLTICQNLYLYLLYSCLVWCIRLVQSLNYLDYNRFCNQPMLFHYRLNLLAFPTLYSSCYIYHCIIYDFDYSIKYHTPLFRYCFPTQLYIC